MATINIEGMDKAAVLAALYNGSRPIGLGVLHYTKEDMIVDEARSLIANYKVGVRGNLYFDYLRGRVMKIRLSGDDLDTDLYNRDNGDGSAEKIINSLKNGE